MSEQKHPMTIKETPGEKLYCTCKKTSTPPYCDGSHPGTGCEPHKMKLEKAQDINICSCGFSANHPFCDGSHYNCLSLE